MRGVYTASIKISGLTTARTLLYVTVPDDIVVEILRASVTNLSNETNEQIECLIQRISSLGTPTKTDITPAKHESGDQASACTVAGNVTASEPTYSANTEIGGEGSPSLGGWYFSPTPEERPRYVQGSFGIRLINTVTSYDAICSITYLEIG